MPSRPTKRIKTVVSAPAAVTTTQLADMSQQPINKDNGKCKFVEMPVELLLEIMSYFPAVPVPTSRRYNTPVLPPSVFERLDVLRALSQTCKLWRSIFFPLLWDRMEACAVRECKRDKKKASGDAMSTTEPKLEEDIYQFRGDDIPASWYKGVSRLLEKVSKGLTNDSQAAQYVRTVNVSLTRYSPGTVLPAFVACLEALPNLQTIQILRVHLNMSPMLNSYFSNHTFPSVRTVIVPEHGQDILRCCPGARKVVCNHGDGSKIITAIGKCCKKVQAVEGIQANTNFIKRLAKALPKLRELKFNLGIEDETKEVLTAFKYLTRLEFQVSWSNPDTHHRDPLIAEIIREGESFLDSQATGKKTFKLFSKPRRNPDDRGWSLDISL